jgi:hypothetical protein
MALVLGVLGQFGNAARCRGRRRAPGGDYGTALRPGSIKTCGIADELGGTAFPHARLASRHGRAASCRWAVGWLVLITAM